MILSRSLGILYFVLLLAPYALAQREPHIGYVYPAGGRQGTTFEAVIGGQHLNNATNVFVSGTGVHVRIIEQEPQVTPKEQQEFKEQLSKLQEKRKNGAKLTPEEVKLAEDIKKMLIASGRKRANPALGEFVTLQITVAPNAAPGEREIRLETQAGLSNPRVFCVGQLPEVSKQDWKNNPQARYGMEPATPPTADIRVTLPATLNGQIPPGGVDRYRFQARARQQLVAAVSAQKLIPYLADAVPGWFQATLALYDANGNELAYDDHFRFHPDPVLFYKIPQNGEYVLEIKDALYRGREDFVYRIAIGELPFVASIFPLGAKVGAQTTVAAGGWNLPVNQLTLDLRNQEPGIYPFSVGWFSNHVPFAVDMLPEIFEKEPNNSPTNAQPVTLPIIINGRVDKPDDWDVFRFEGRAGDEIVAEVYARRLDSPLDSVLKLTDSTDQQLAFNDDHEDKGSGLTTHHADSYLTATLPANGTYYLHLGDAQHKGGPDYAYRLRISPPRPDFELRVVPSSINVRAGGTVSITVYALRKDGFTGEIALALEDAPEGFRLSNGRVPAKQDQVRLTLTAPPRPQPEPISLHLAGRATIQDQEIARPAVPADDMMQAFAYRHLVPAQDLQVAVVDRFMPQAAAKILTATPIKIPAGGTALVQVRLLTGPFAGKVQFELNNPPKGIAIRSVIPLREGTGIVLQTDPTKVKRGLTGNLIVNAFTMQKPESGTGNPQAAARRIPLGALPAIGFEIIKP